MSDLTVWRFTATTFVLCVLALSFLLALWLRYELGAEVSPYDLGSPQLRAFV